MKIVSVLILFLSTSLWAQSSMRRCTLLPITDSVGGAIGFKVFEEVEAELKKSNWCTYVSNSGMINVFSKYRENLPQFLKTKEVLSTVAQKLKVGSIVRVGIINEVRGVEVQMEVYGEDGEDIYFSEKTILNSDEIELISSSVKNWLDMYAKMIPYDAKINGILGDQITLDVGKGYPIQVGQTFIVKRPIAEKKHPLLKKIVDWDTEVLAEGKVFNISDNQALGMVKVYKQDKKLAAGDWVRLEEWQQAVIDDPNIKDKEIENPGTLGILSLALYGSSATLATSPAGGAVSMDGTLYGIDVRGEGWITRQYFAAVEIARSLGSLKKASGNPTKNEVDGNNGVFKLTGGYKYLPIGFFYGPQVDVYGGYVNYTYDYSLSAADGFGKSSFSGIAVGLAANVPVSREFRVFARGEFIPFPTFKDDDSIYGSAKSVSSLDLEFGVKYQYTVRTTIDGSLEAISQKAKLKSGISEVSHNDRRLKIGMSFNF